MHEFITDQMKSESDNNGNVLSFTDKKLQLEIENTFRRSYVRECQENLLIFAVKLRVGSKADQLEAFRRFRRAADKLETEFIAEVF